MFSVQIVQVFDEFCTSSSVHGVRYFVDPKRHLVERYEIDSIHFIEYIRIILIDFLVGIDKSKDLVGNCIRIISIFVCEPNLYIMVEMARESGHYKF